MQAVVNQDTVRRFKYIVEENFYNGIRDDDIDINKILNLFSYYYPGEIILRDLLMEIIHTNGIENSGRFYFFSDDRIDTIQCFLDEILKKSSIAYYSSVYQTNFNFFYQMHIYSQEVMKKTLQLFDRRHFHFPDFCANTKYARLDIEIAKIFNKSNNPLSVDDLLKKLPYVPADKIAAVLSDSKNYFMTYQRNYISISKIQFDLEEIEKNKDKLFQYLDSEGVANLDDCNFSSNFALNLNLTERDLKNIIYEKFFSRTFIKRGNKLFKKTASSQKNNSMSLCDSLRHFVDNQNELSVKKLFNVAQNFNIDSNLALSIAYEKMIRIDKNFLVKDSLINFDVDKIDCALADFVQNKIIPLPAVTSFTCFPQVENYSWNLFLLESFLRKFSQKYVFRSTGTNSANTGSIYPKSMKFADYFEVQVAAVVQEKIPLKKFDVEEFLIGQGYRTKRFGNVTEKIIERAQEILNR